MRYLLFLFCAFLPWAIHAQSVVDDSTKIVNGYKSTIYLRAADILHGETTGRRLDTVLHNFQNTDEWHYQNGERQKNLGYIGSPQQEMFYRHTTRIGRSLGLDATSYLTYHPDSVRYFRSYNLYSRIKYNQGSYGRQYIEVEAAKNIAENFNVGVALRRLTAQKQLGTSTFKQKGVDETTYLVHFNGSLFNNHYILLGSLSNFKQTITESGGIVDKDGASGAELYKFTEAFTQFPNSGSSVERRRSGRLHNIFRIDTALPHLIVSAGFESYRYEFSLLRSANLTEGDGSEALRYKSFFLSTDQTNNDLQYDMVFVNPKLVETIGPVQLEASYNLRRHRYANQKLDLNIVNEGIASARGMLDTRYGKLTLEAASVPRRDNSVSADLRSEWFFANVGRAQISPTFVAQNLVSNHFLWKNAFGLEKLLWAEAGVHLATPNIGLGVSMRNQTLTNGIFYKQGAGDTEQGFNPYQESSRVNTLTLKANARLTVKNFTWDLFAQTANPNRQDLMPQPRLFLHTTPSFTFSFKEGRYQVNPGIEAWYRTDFYGQAYDPSTGIFFLQNQDPTTRFSFPKSQRLDPYVWTCVFVNIKINNTRAYIKVGNATQGIIGPGGYYDVPFYPGQQRYFEFGIDWVFFD